MATDQGGQTSKPGQSSKLGQAETTFDTDAAQRILKRAISYDATDHRPAADGLTEEALAQAAEEIGMDPAYVRAAVTEERLGLLQEQRRLLDPIVGAGTVTVSRVLSMQADHAMAMTEEWLTRTLMFSRIRSDVDGITYVSRGDLVASVRRGVGTMKGTPNLSRARTIKARAAEVESGMALLVLEADLALERVLTIAGSGTIAGVGSALSLLGALGAGADLALLGVPVSFTAATAVLVIRSHSVSKVAVGLERLLELVEGGTQPGSRINVAAKRILRGPDRG